MAAMGTLEQMEARVQTTRDTSTCSAAQIKALPCQQGDASPNVERLGSQIQLPEVETSLAAHKHQQLRRWHNTFFRTSEDILHRIHAVMPMRDAARASCVSPCFLRSWRSYPELILTIDSLGLKISAFNKDAVTRNFVDRVDHIMQNHSGMGVKTFKLRTYPCSNLHTGYVDRWLQVAITPGIKEFELSMYKRGDIKYGFPCSFLSSERIRSIQKFWLGGCSFHSAAQVGCMSNLTNLKLCSVQITGEELYGFLSNSRALKQFYLSGCGDIICLKIPSLLQQLSSLDVLSCSKLETIDSIAPNLSTFFYAGHPIHISLGDALQVRDVTICRDNSSGALYYARTKLPSVAPNLHALMLSTSDEKVNTPTACGKFLQLKYLQIEVSASKFSQDYDFGSLVSFLDASPTLETFILRIAVPTIRSDSIVEDSDGDSSQPPSPSECYHENLKTVMITGFCSAKSMIKLTIQIIEKTKALECLTLDTTRGHDMRSAKVDRCFRLSKEALVEAEKARVAIRRHVEGRVPSSVKLKVIEPCSKCVY
ncbi:hypothetical protein ACP70R_007396 [Stipagrostis hirtigluma subsp. patula]